MRRMQRPLHRRLHRMPPVPPSRTRLRRRMPPVPPPRARLRRRMPPVPPPPRQASPRTPPRLLPLKPQRRHAHTDGPESTTLPGPFLIGSATSRTGLASRRAWHENARHTSPTDPRHAQHVARPPHPSRASATQKHGTDRQQHGHERRQHGLFRHRQGHGRVTERPSFTSPTAPTHLYPHSPPCEALQPQGQKTPRSFNGGCRRTDYGKHRSPSSLILQKKLNKTQQTNSSQTTTGTKNTPFNAESTMHVCHHFSEKQLPAKCKERHVTPPRRQQQDVEKYTAPPCGQRDIERHAASQCSRHRNTERYAAL